VRGGVKVAFGTDAAVIPHGTNAREFATMVRFGMAPIDALRAATSGAADLLGRARAGLARRGEARRRHRRAGRPDAGRRGDGSACCS
jgi:imidazolonepropionase-like amidohydrolase